MPVTTYLNPEDYLQPTGNAELNALLAQVRKNTGKDWRLCEHRFTEVTGIWPFYKRKKRVLYSVYVEVQGPEFQVINFYREDTGTSINESNEAGYVAAYFYGILANRK